MVKKCPKKVIRDTWASITYYFAKYHVLLCEVSLCVFFASKHIKKNTNLTLSIEYISIRTIHEIRVP